MITLSESAAERVKGYMERRGDSLGLRLGLRKTGCSGWAYMVDYAQEVAQDDRVFEDKGVKVLVAEEHLALLDGMHIDFVKQGLNEMFRFENPNATDECGCGESVSF